MFGPQDSLTTKAMQIQLLETSNASSRNCSSSSSNCNSCSRTSWVDRHWPVTRIVWSPRIRQQEILEVIIAVKGQYSKYGCSCRVRTVSCNANKTNSKTIIKYCNNMSPTKIKLNSKPCNNKKGLKLVGGYILSPAAKLYTGWFTCFRVEKIDHENKSTKFQVKTFEKPQRRKQHHQHSKK